MTEQSPKIITTFQNRLEMDAAVRGLGQLSGNAELRQRSDEIAATYGARVIPALLAALDTGNPQLRGGLGYLAAALEREDIVPALSNAAYNRGLPDQARLAAITILERFVDVAPDPAMYAGMAAPEQLALQSLREVLGEARSDRMILVEYLAQLAQEPADVLLTMVKSTRRLESDEGVDLLRMFAQDVYRPAAQEALQILGTIAQPAAAEALHCLIPQLAPDLRTLAERSWQKLRLRGVPIAPRAAPPPAARCLISPIDSTGSQVIWFLLPAAEPAASDVLQLLTDDQEGMSQAGGGYAIANDTIPPVLPLGAVHMAPTGQGAPQIMLLEAPFDFGRRRVVAVLAAAQASNRPLPPAYRLLSPLLWQWTKPEPAPELPARPGSSAEQTVELLRHPAMAGWFLQTPAIHEMAQRLLLAAEDVTPEQVEQMLGDLVRGIVASDEQFLARLKSHLLVMQEWLTLANDPNAADLCGAAADTLEQAGASHPLLLQMAALGLRMAMLAFLGGFAALHPKVKPPSS